MNIKNLYGLLFEDKLSIKTNDYIRKGIVEDFNLYATFIIKEDIEKLRQLITPATIKKLKSLFPLLKEQFVIKPYHNPKLADIEKKISDLYNKEITKKVFWETISILHRDRKLFYWVDNVILYVLTNKILAPKDPIQFYPMNGYVRVEIQPEATCREHYRPSYKNQYTVLSDAGIQYPFDVPKKLPRAYIERKELVREVIVLELMCGYNAHDFNKQWKLVEPLQKDIIRRRGFIKSLRIKSTYDTVLKEIKEGKEIKVEKPNTRISEKGSYYKRKDSSDRYYETINRLGTYPDNIKQILIDEGFIDRKWFVKMQGTSFPISFKDKMIKTGSMNEATLNALMKDINVRRGEQKDYLDSKLKKDKYRTAKRRYSPKMPVHT